MALSHTLTTKNTETLPVFLKNEKGKRRSPRVGLSIRFAGLMLKTYMAMSTVWLFIDKMSHIRKSSL